MSSCRRNTGQQWKELSSLLRECFGALGGPAARQFGTCEWVLESCLRCITRVFLEAECSTGRKREW